MTKQAIIERTLKVLEQLPSAKVVEVSDYAEYLLYKYQEKLLSKGIQEMTSESDTFAFLREEEELYTRRDLKESFNNVSP